MSGRSLTDEKWPKFSLEGKRVFVAGHRGMVGSAIVRRLQSERCEIVTADRQSLDLIDQASVRAWFARERPQVVFHAGAKVGGILVNNSYPAEFIYNNVMIASNVIEAAFRCEVKKLLFLGSSCIYPKNSPQPISEESLLAGPLEPTNEWYAIAKIAGIKLCQAFRRQHNVDFISAMPTNLYGPGDNYDLQSSHVVPALIRKCHAAKLNDPGVLELWGTGSPRREFLHVDDCADALVYIMKNYSSDEHINVGYGKDISILELARLIASIVGFGGDIVLDKSRPDGVYQKLMSDVRLRSLGWEPSIDLARGIEMTYKEFLKSHGFSR